MFTLFVANAIPLYGPVQSTPQTRPRQLQAIELAAFGMLLGGIRVMSNHLANTLLNQFISG
ncbi:hypothetical protein [Acaryochloris sp. IP29b_bin.148]|uniref:hypothetical protein n=1 Tax=Acaryochloris sp. IP29b_bin.148 TaxID=2969218 RepID=UPI00262D5A86|nr:hypothetical protein [Acaryochloris sp. IP29b_bin.148]